MVDEQYNPGLCKERHRHIEEKFANMDVIYTNRLDKLENRFLKIMTVLVFNLLGILVTLILMIIRTGAK